MSAGRGEERFAAGREEGEGKDEQATRSPGGARSTMGPAGCSGWQNDSWRAGAKIEEPDPQDAWQAWTA